MKKQIRRELAVRACRILTILLCVMITAVFTLGSAELGEVYAGNKITKKMTVYREVIKKGSKVYCMVNNDGFYYQLFRVDLKTGKVTKLAGKQLCARGMRYRKGYIYIGCGNTDTEEGALIRVNVKSGKWKFLANIAVNESPEFAFSNNKLFYRYVKYKWSKDYENLTIISKYKQMSPNGKGKKNAKNIEIKTKRKNSNSKEYKLVYKGKSGNIGKCYLQKPSGKKIYLCKVKNYYS